MRFILLCLLFCQQARAQHWYLQENQFIYPDFWYAKVPSNVTGFHTAIHEIWLPAQSAWRNQLRIDHKFGTLTAPKTRNIATWNTTTNAWTTVFNDTLLYQNADLQQVVTRKPIAGVLQNAWRMVLEYAPNGLVKTNTNQSFNNNSWNNDYRDTTIFQNNRPYLRMQQIWAGSPFNLWGDDARDSFLYDGNGKLSVHYWQAFLGGRFYTGQRDLITYNAAGKRAELRREFFNDISTTYDTIFRWKYHYNPLGYLDTLTREQYNRTVRIWQTHTRITLTLNALGIVVQELVQTPSGNTWQNASRTTYNLTGTPTQEPPQWSGLSLFPNPFENTFWVKATFDTPENIQLFVTNVAGQILFVENYKQIASLNQPITLSHLPKGAYFVSIRGESGQITRKIIH